MPDAQTVISKRRASMKEKGFATAVQPDIQETSAPVVPKEYRLYFGLLVTCFALWGLLNNMTDNLVPSFAKIFMGELSS